MTSNAILTNPIVELMCSFTYSSYDIRVWYEATTELMEGCRGYNTYSELKIYQHTDAELHTSITSKVTALTAALETSNARTITKIAEVLSNVDNVNAVEVKDETERGMVAYRSWP